MGEPGRRPSPNSVGLPVRAFLFTIDQISTMTNVDENTVKRHYLHFEGRALGPRPPAKMIARNIAPEGEKPDWRVAEREFLRWLRRQGFRVYDRGWPIL